MVITMAKFIMVVGTSSNSGKTVLVAGICRILANKGYKVAPFKSQNMSLNSRVAKEDGEIAVAQYTQSLACKTEPSVHFNPILLKPMGNYKSQIIVHGKPYKKIDFDQYRKEKNYYLNKIKESLEYLDKNYDYVVIEGAGSCCEINLLKDDIANLKVAELCNAKSILVSDIDRGGVFASLYGTVELLPNNWRKLIKGFVINKFRGNPDLLINGYKKIEQLTNIPVLGTIPYNEKLELPEEDSQALQNKKTFGNINSNIEINVLKLSKLSNFTDIDSLSEDSLIKFINFDEDITGDILIIPGTRSSTNEMALIKKYKFDKKVKEFIKKENKIIIGICGGYQLLGEKLIDDNYSEGETGTINGIGLFNMETKFGNKKAIFNSNGIGNINNNEFLLNGYEIHEGISYSNEKPFIKLNKGFGNNGSGFDGSIKIENNNLIIGTYFHGIFDNYKFRNYILNKILINKGIKNLIENDNYKNNFENNINKFAEIIENSVNLKDIF